MHIDSHFKNQNLESHYQYLATRRPCTYCRKIFAAFVLELQLNVCEFAQLPQARTDSSCCRALSL